MSDIRIPVTGTSGRTHLRSAVHCDLVVPRTRLVRYGPRGFAVSGPVTWNSLPPDIRDMSLSATSFLIQLKTEMFIRAYYVTSYSTFVITEGINNSHSVVLYCISLVK